tara:strand:- start:56 stop:1027 length:972 start_codon:yes stop_codon:yes gene_type:complete
MSNELQAPMQNVNPINNVKNVMQNTGQAITQNFTSVAGNLKQTTDDLFDSFRNNKFVSGTADFLESNSAIAKVAFLILILILFTFVLRLGTTMIHSFFAPSPNPFLIKGMRRGNQPIRILQHPKYSESIPIMRSKNQNSGIEFTWNTWLFIETVKNTGKDYQHIFHKGDDLLNKNNISSINNGPGLYIQKDMTLNQIKLRVLMSSYDNPKGADIEIPNIPLQKWFNVTIRVKHKFLDVYVNNNIAHRHIFEGAPPKQNYGNVYVSQQNGFEGLISNLRYFNRAISGVEIANIVSQGANLQSSGSDSLSINPPYFSMRWYLPKD